MTTSLTDSSKRPAGPCRGSVVLLSLYSKSGTPARVTGITGEFASGPITDGMVAAAPLGLDCHEEQKYWFWKTERAFVIESKFGPPLMCCYHSEAAAFRDEEIDPADFATSHHNSVQCASVSELIQLIQGWNIPERLYDETCHGLYFPEDGSKVYL